MIALHLPHFDHPAVSVTSVLPLLLIMMMMMQVGVDIGKEVANAPLDPAALVQVGATAGAPAAAATGGASSSAVSLAQWRLS